MFPRAFPRSSGPPVRPNAAGLSNTDATREMIRDWTGMAKPAATFVAAGSAVRKLAAQPTLWVVLASQLVVEVVVAADNGEGGVAEQRLHQGE